MNDNSTGNILKQQGFDDRLASFLRAIERLEEAVALDEDPIVRDAVIQRFEFTYELAWKTAKRWLASKDIDVRNAKDTLSAALSQGLIEDGNGWSQLHEMRNLTSHTYDERTAQRVYHFVQAQAVSLFKALYAKLC